MWNPEYIAPELYEPNARFTPACDIYSLGISGIELITGSRQRESIKSIWINNEVSALLWEMTSWMPNARPDAAAVVSRVKNLIETYNETFKTVVTVGGLGLLGFCLYKAFSFRFVQQLQDEGFLSESGSYLNLVRRDELFRRWQASAVRSVKEVPIRFLLTQLRRMLNSGRACLALFAAAEALKLGFVEGVPPYLYVERIRPANPAAWKNLRPCESRERPDVILRQAPAPQSVFRALVRPDGMASCDVLQVWVDVSSHPSRGREQADLIRRRVLAKVIERKG